MARFVQTGTYARQILNRLLIDLSWNSSRLEGNTYSLLEQARFVEVAETELQNLHKGNFARYRVRPSQVEAWRKMWRPRNRLF